MASLYHPEAQFRDEVFDLKSGAEAGAMWKMLVGRGGDLRIEFRDVVEDENGGSAHWDAWYTFSGTGRKVLNRIEARFEFKDGLIYRHTDRFNFWRWSGQALGMFGWLLGWTSVIKEKVRGNAMGRLRAFIAADQKQQA